ncbi:MAG: MBL fold metallo-hydrolase [Candidatus Thorarchaeota archaeon]|jgi:L-ascorbate metabolism protein UlaG (beta-lactamase superfamily)
MQLTANSKIALGAFIVVALTTSILLLSAVDLGVPEDSATVTLLINAGVMIEAEGLRIYIDPVDLPASYGDRPADAVLITHDHGDHYQSSVVDMLQKEGTVNVFPAIMTTAIEAHDGFGVNPEDQIQVGSANITAFYMYTFAVDGYDASHPIASNFTSYIVDINGFAVFHAGDSKTLDEYSELSGRIDVAMLPLGPGCQTMTDDEVFVAIQRIQPEYFIPIHFAEGAVDVFCSSYRTQIEGTTGCQVVDLAPYASRTFQMDTDSVSQAIESGNCVTVVLLD